MDWRSKKNFGSSIHGLAIQKKFWIANPWIDDQRIDDPKKFLDRRSMDRQSMDWIDPARNPGSPLDRNDPNEPPMIIPISF